MRTDRLALAAAAALAATAARAQWRAEPMVLWLDGPRDVVAGELGGSAGADLLALDETSSASRLLEHGRLLAPQAGAFAFPPPFRAVTFRAGRLAQPGGGDALADVARVGGGGLVEVAFGSAPGTVQPLSIPPVGANDAVGFVHLLPRDADVLVVPMQASEPTFAGFAAYDFDPGVVSSSWRIGGGPAPDGVHLTLMSSGGVDVAGLRLSGVARASGIDDVALLGFGGLVLNVHVQAPAAPSLAAVRLSGPIEVGGNRDQYAPGDVPPWLPPTVPLQGDTLGAAALDVDLDGDLDLVFAQSRSAAVAGGAPQQARVVWAEGTGDAADFGDPALAPWRDLGLALGLTAPLLVRQVWVGDEPAVATWDHAAQHAVVIWNDGGIQRVWRGSAKGRRATEILAADVAGSPAPDLVVVVENGGVQPGTVYVYPDLGEPGPILGWAPGSPGTPARGVAHAVSVTLDPAGAATATIDWIEGLPTAAPVASGEGLFTHPFDPDCAASPGPLTFTVRATDAHGVFTERTETLFLDVLEPALSLRGASPPRRLLLPPGGTTAVVDGVAATGCGGASFGGAWPAGSTVTDEVRPASIVRTVDLPESVYPALLADPALVVSLATTDVPGPPRVVSLAVELDASGLVEVTQSADRTSLAEGGLALVRTTLRSRLAVPLPSVRVTSALAGLAPAGPPTVSGATIVSSAADGTDLVLDALPAGAGVTIDLPVRASGGAQGVAAVEARSSGGWLLTPAARPDAEEAALPGCGCGTGAGAGWIAIALLAMAVRRRS